MVWLVKKARMVKAELEEERGFRIDCRLRGFIASPGPVVVEENGVVVGDVRGSHVMVHGRVLGDVTAEGHVEVGPRGFVLGHVRMGSLRVHRGGVIRTLKGDVPESGIWPVDDPQVNDDIARCLQRLDECGADDRPARAQGDVGA